MVIHGEKSFSRLTIGNAQTVTSVDNSGEWGHLTYSINCEGDGER